MAHNFKILSDSNIELDFEIEVSGFGYGEIEELVMSIEGVEDHSQMKGDDEACQEEYLDGVVVDEARPICQLGDIWELGDHRILCGDSLNADSYQLLLNSGVDLESNMGATEKAAMIFTDPPYNLSARSIGKVAEAIHGDFHEAAGEMTSDEFEDYLSRLFKLLCEYSSSGSIHYICMDWRHLYEILTAGRKNYTELKNICVWNKDRAGMGSFYRSQHEMVLVYKNGKASHQNNFQLGQYGRYRTNVWSYTSVRSHSDNQADLSDQVALEIHPTIKPISLVRDAILDCSRRGEIVLDVFLGSGTTLLAAEQSHRRCVGIEIEPRYVDTTIHRWQEMTGLEAVNLQTGQSFNRIAEGRTSVSDEVAVSGGVL